MEKFKYQGSAEVLHVNARKVGGEDEDKVLATDIKVSAVADKSILDYFDPTVEGDTGPRLVDALFLRGGAVRNAMLGPITFTNELEHYALDVFGQRLLGCKVKKFAAEPQDVNMIVITFQISFEPTGDLIAQIAEFLQEGVDIYLRPEDGELPLEGGSQ